MARWVPTAPLAMMEGQEFARAGWAEVVLQNDTGQVTSEMIESLKSRTQGRDSCQPRMPSPGLYDVAGGRGGCTGEPVKVGSTNRMVHMQTRSATTNHRRLMTQMLSDQILLSLCSKARSVRVPARVP